MITHGELMRGLRKGSLLPAYLFFGDEEFLIQEALNLIIRRTVDPASQDFNFNTVYCRSASADEIVGLCQTLPFMAERRLVVAREIGSLKAADLELLTSYLKDPSPSTCLVMIANQPKYDKKAVLTAVDGHGAVVRFYPLLDRDMLSWIDGWAKERGLGIQREAAQYVWQTLGNDLQAISNELAKAVIYARERKTITLEDVRVVVGDFREFTPFDLADALGMKERERALFILGRLLQEGEQPVGLLGSIAWNFRRLLRAKALEAAGSTFEEIKKKLHVIFHQADSFHKQVRRYSMEELEEAFSLLLEADRTLKTSSGMGGRLILERLILQFCGA